MTSGSDIFTLELDMITFAGLAALLLMFGTWMTKRYKVLWKYSIPSPVIGGFSFAILMLIMKEFGLLQIVFDNTLNDLFMYVFFVTIGLNTGLGLIKKGGRLLFFYILICWVLSILQNGIGIGMSFLTGVDPLVGLMSGQPAMQGGHGMAASMAPVIEAVGGDGALTIGMAAATYGLIAGSLIGGPVGNWLINKNGLKIETDQTGLNDLEHHAKEGAQEQVTSHGILVTGTLIFVILAIGLPTAKWITNVTGFAIPGHIFSLFLGVLFRSINDRSGMIHVPAKEMNIVSTVSLEMFLIMAMMNLKLWELYDLALPLIIMLVVQTIFTVLLAVFVMFRAMGKNYDAALLSAGFIGHGLGATPNGLVVMDAICRKYGLFSPKAFLFIPIAGTVLTDIFAVPLFVFLANLFGH